MLLHIPIMCLSSAETTVFMWQLIYFIPCAGAYAPAYPDYVPIISRNNCVYWYFLFCVQEHMLLHTRQSSTQNNKYQVSHKHSFISWWRAHSRSKHVEIYKYTKNKLCTKLVIFTKLYRDARSTKHKIVAKFLKRELKLHLLQFTSKLCFNFQLINSRYTWKCPWWSASLSFIHSVVCLRRQVHKPFQSQFSTQCDPVLPLSTSNILQFP